MIKSMTGFGRGRVENEGRIFTVEIKSVNHKYSEVNIRLPRMFNSFEDKIRSRIAGEISRGKIDVYISFENFSSKGINIKMNRDLAKEYLEELNSLAEDTGLSNNVTALELSRFPEVLKIDEEDESEELAEDLMNALDEALRNFVKMREVEGEKLALDLEKRIDFVEQKVNEISEFSQTVVTDYMEKLENRIKELLKTDVVDKDRLAQEIVYFSDKSSIEEELTRLKSHISQFRVFLKGDSPIGKKFDFLVQEINRETNTIASKANCLDITNRVIEVKTEVENIREQIQNIE